MMNKVKVGVFGAYRGMTMIKFSAKYPEVELTAICDKYEPALEKCKEVMAEECKNGSHPALYTDFDEFIQHDMDAVVLANYANEHAPFAIRCLKAGKHVISEVLPVQTLAEAVQLVEAVEESGLVYAYAENYCYFPSTSEMRKLYREGKLGEVEYAEGEYIHDCESIWPSITYGERDHWRNRMYATFYCTHSLGPIIHITGLRPVRVTGFETPLTERMQKLGRRSPDGGIEMVELENGAVVKSVHGGMVREPSAVWYSLYGNKGMAESSRWKELVEEINVYTKEKGEVITYKPAPVVDTEVSRSIATHGGGDFYTMHYFIQKILGRPEGAESIDIYEALDMFLPGLIAYKSVLNGGIPLPVPDFRNKEERGRCRFDTFCTDPAVAGAMLAPPYSKGEPEIPDSVYENVRKMWIEQEAEKARKEKEEKMKGKAEAKHE